MCIYPQCIHTQAFTKCDVTLFVDGDKLALFYKIWSNWLKGYLKANDGMEKYRKIMKQEKEQTEVNRRKYVWTLAYQESHDL